MNQPSSNITSLIKKNRVLTLSILEPDNTLWACNTFYAFDENLVCLYILSEMRTSHAQAMLTHPHVAGTISKTPKSIADIQGIQYKATASLLSDDAAKTAYNLYYKAFPFARAFKAPIWALELQYIKYTNNRLGFAHKENWLRT